MAEQDEEIDLNFFDTGEGPTNLPSRISTLDSVHMIRGDVSRRLFVPRKHKRQIIPGAEQV